MPVLRAMVCDECSGLLVDRDGDPVLCSRRQDLEDEAAGSGWKDLDVPGKRCYRPKRYVCRECVRILAAADQLISNKS